MDIIDRLVAGERSAMELKYGNSVFVRDCIRVYTGRYLNILDIQPDDIDIIDIAHGLSTRARFCGHMDAGVYTVAQHSVWVSKQVPDEDALTALMHDASEAYMSDIPKPIKNHLPDYLTLEDKLMEVISTKYGCVHPLPASVKEWDTKALIYEWDEGVVNNKLVCLSQKDARLEFYKRFLELRGIC